MVIRTDSIVEDNAKIVIAAGWDSLNLIKAYAKGNEDQVDSLDTFFKAGGESEKPLVEEVCDDLSTILGSKGGDKLVSESMKAKKLPAAAPNKATQFFLGLKEGNKKLKHKVGEVPH